VARAAAVLSASDALVARASAGELSEADWSRLRELAEPYDEPTYHDVWTAGWNAAQTLRELSPLG
jgi:hypothetical protein